MTNKTALGGKNSHWILGIAFLGVFGLIGCVVQPVGGVAYVGPPAAVYVAPAPVVVEPELVMPIPIFIGGGGRYRR